MKKGSNHKTPFFIVILFFWVANLSVLAYGIERFPPPDFEETNHQLPGTTTPAPRANILEYVDAAVLFVCLVLAAYLVLKKRNRKWIFGLMIFSLVYFGFYRQGCICSIGAIGNVTLTLFASDYVLPLSALLFFVLPLVFALFFGRVFCGAVCPLGAIQDAVLLKPVKVPGWLESSLRMLAYIYLGLAVLFAAVGNSFIICRYDPFVSFFRLSGSANMLIIGGCFLVIGIFVGRVYCRFLCPYGVILRFFSRFSRWRITITPDECIQCRLCEDSCPFGAINEPVEQWPRQTYEKSKKRLVYLLVLLPVIVLVTGFVFHLASGAMSRIHPTVQLAERIYQEENSLVKGTTDASLAYRSQQGDIQKLYDEVAVIQARFSTGSWFVGFFVGLVSVLKLIENTLRNTKSDYEPDKGGCLACGRCFECCPQEQQRIKELKGILN